MAKQPLIISDKDRYEKYTDVGKSYFDGMMYSVLEMMPKIDGKWHAMCMPFAENFAFGATDTFLLEVDKKIDEKMKAFKSEIDTIISGIQSSLANLATAPTTPPTE